MRKWWIAAVACAIVGGVTSALLMAEVGCMPGVTPSSAFNAVVATVKADVTAGDGLPQIETDVAKDLSQDVSPTVDVLIEDALTLLIDAGELAPLVLGNAKALQQAVHPKAMAAREHP